MLAVVLQFTKPFSCRFVGMVCLLAGLAGLALACDTPVYRYAMYRWEPAPYEIYYFHDKPLDEQAAQVQKLVEAASRSEEKPANLFFVAVSLTDDPELKKIPPDVRKAWQDQQDRPVPSYLVVTPHGRKLYQGALDEPILKAMLDSPARTRGRQTTGRGQSRGADPVVRQRCGRQRSGGEGDQGTDRRRGSRQGRVVSAAGDGRGGRGRRRGRAGQSRPATRIHQNSRGPIPPRNG